MGITTSPLQDEIQTLVEGIHTVIEALEGNPDIDRCIAYLKGLIQ